MMAMAFLLQAAHAQFPAPYCPEAFSNGREPITSVQFAGINNSSPATTSGAVSHEDFTGINGTVTTGDTFTITLKGNTAGSFTNRLFVFIDWNQDNDFLDEHEVYNIGTITGSTGTDAISVTGNIAVPATALTGTTRMRVWKRFSVSTATVCNTSGYGQAEDYTLSVMNSSCKMPRSFAIAPSYNSAVMSWTVPLSGSPDSGYEWEVRTSGAAGSGITGLAGSGSTDLLSDTIPGLTPSTTYTAYIRANCGTDQSLWTSISFTTSAAPTDLQALQLQAPANSSFGCYSSAVPVIIRIRNAGTAALDLGAVNAIVSGAIISPAAEETGFMIDTLTGSLAAGATRDVLVYTGYDMSLEGDYIFEANASIDGDMNMANDDMPATARTSATPSGLPQLVNFYGYSGTSTSLDATFPGWHEATGIYPAAPVIGGESSFTALTAAQRGAFEHGCRMPFTGTNSGWIVSPKINIPSAGYKFDFKAIVTNAGTAAAATFTTGGNDTARILVSNDCGNTWTTLMVFNNAEPNGLTSSATGLTAFSLDLDTYTGQNIMIAVYAKRSTSFSTSTADFILADAEITNCSAPTNLSVTAIGTTTTTGTWTEPSPVAANGYEWKVIRAGQDINTATAIASGSISAGNTASISGLPPYTNNYDFYVRSNCSDMDHSGWAGPENFQTICSEPTMRPTDLLLNATASSVQGIFTKVAGGEANGYMVIRTGTGLSAPAAPADGTSYTAGAVYGAGSTCVYFGSDSAFNSPGLISNTGYKFWVIPYNTTPCTGGPNYLTTTPLNNTINTCPGIPSAEIALNAATGSFDVYWEPPASSGAAADISYDLQIAKNALFTLDTVTFPGVTATYNVTGLAAFTKYWFRIRGNNGCYGAWTSNAADTIRTLPFACTTPESQPSALILNSNAAGTAINGSFSAVEPASSNYLIVRTTGDVIPAAPADGTIYPTGSTALGTNTKVIANDTATSFNDNGLTGNTAYTYYVYSFNHYACEGGPKYLAADPLSGTDTTCLSPMSSVVADSITNNSFKLSWAGVSGGAAAPVNYIIEVAEDTDYTATVAGSPFTVTDPVVNIAVTGLSAETPYFYRIKATNGSCENSWAAGNIMTLCTPGEITGTLAGTRCGEGPVDLAASTAGAGVLYWYTSAIGGSPLGTGSSFTTPVITATTDFYVSSELINEGEVIVGSVGTTSSSAPQSPANGGWGGMKGQYLFRAQELINAGLRAGNIHTLSLDIATAGSTLAGFVIQMGSTSDTAWSSTPNIAGGLTTVFPADSFAPVAGLNTFTFATPFDWDGESNIIVSTSWSNNNTSNSSSSVKTSTTTYLSSQSYRKDSETAVNMLAFTGSSAGTGILSTAYSRPRMHFTGQKACSSERLPVTATVTPAPPIMVSADTIICEGGSALLAAGSTNPGYTYTWSPAATLSSSAGSTVTATPGSTTTYTVTATDTSACSISGTVTVTIEAIPPAPVILQSDSIICLGEAVTLSTDMNRMAEDMETFPSENFSITGTGLSAAANTTYYKEGASSVRLSYTSGSEGAYAMTTDINLNSLPDPRLSFWHIGGIEGDAIGSNWDIGKLDYSIDGGVTWTIFPAEAYEGTGSLALTTGADAGGIMFNQASYADWDTQFTGAASTPGTGPATALWKEEIIDLSSFVSDSFRIRFRLKSDGSVNYYGWLIDNVKIGGQGMVSWSASPAADAGLSPDAAIPSESNRNIVVTPVSNGLYDYAATITTPAGCTSAPAVSAIIVNTTIATLGSISNPETCGGNEGSISISGLTAGGTYTAAYTADGSPVAGIPLVLTGTSATISGLAAGYYEDIIITETGMCPGTALGPVTLSDPESPVISSSSQAPAACGIDNGKIIISGSGIPAFSTYIVQYQKDGAAAYTYDTVFTGTAGQLEITNLAGGSYDSISIRNIVSMCTSGIYGPVTITSDGIDSTIAPATSTMNYDQGAGTRVSYTDGSCRLISTVEAINGALGTVAATVIVGPPDTIAGAEPVLGRLFSFTATNNIGARVTIYLDQADIDAYNALPQIGTPEYPSIGSSLEHLQFTVFHSLPGSGDGPFGYDNDPTKKEVIPLSEMSITAPATETGYWAVTFDLDSFSLVIPHTNAAGTALPIRLGEISAVNTGATNRVDWNTLDESDGDVFDIERSTDGRHFTRLGTINAKGSASRYSFIDTEPFEGINYYRLKIVNADGAPAYSRIVNAIVKVSGFYVNAYPNPVSSDLFVEVKGGMTGKGIIWLSDITGRTIGIHPVDASGSVTISMAHLAQGIYLVKYQDDLNSQTIRIDKK